MHVHGKRSRVIVFDRMETKDDAFLDCELHEYAFAWHEISVHSSHKNHAVMHIRTHVSTLSTLRSSTNANT